MLVLIYTLLIFGDNWGFSYCSSSVTKNWLQTLRAMPVVDLETPTLCLVGAPNVGKSSLVRVLSTGKPEVLANLPLQTWNLSFLLPLLF